MKTALIAIMLGLFSVATVATATTTDHKGVKVAKKKGKHKKEEKKAEEPAPTPPAGEPAPSPVAPQ